MTQALQGYVHGPTLLPVRTRGSKLNCKACIDAFLPLVISLPHLFLLQSINQYFQSRWVNFDHLTNSLR